MTAVTLGLTAGSTLMQHQEQVKAAEKQGAALVLQDSLRQMDLERQMGQQQEQAAEEMNSAHRTAMSNMATLHAIAGEYGGGATADRGMAVADAQAGESLATIASNARNGLAETGYTSVATRQNTLSQIRSIQPPSPVGTMLSIGASAANAYGSYKTQQQLNDLASRGQSARAPKAVQ